MAGDISRLDLPTLEAWLWDAACVIRGLLDAPRFKDYILPLIFLKRLSDVFDEEIQLLGQAVQSPSTFPAMFYLQGLAVRQTT